METGNAEFHRAVYIQTSTNLNNIKIDYKLKNCFDAVNNTLFTEIVRLEYDNGYHNRSRYFDYWLYFKTDAWSRSVKTGLAKTPCVNLFEGNISRELDLQIKTSKGTNFETEQHLVIVQSNNLFKCITVDIFKDFYIRKKEILKYFTIEHHKKHPIINKEPITDSLFCSNVCNNGQR